MAESKEELKSFLMKVKAGLKLNIRKTKIMPFSPITQMGKKWKQWQILFSWSPKSLWMVTAVIRLKDACPLEEKLWQTDSILKNRDIILLTKVHIVKTMVFMYRYENWTIKMAVKVKVTHSCPTLCDPMDYTVHGILQARILQWVAFSAEHQRIDAFKLWCWRRLLRVP